MRWVGWVGAVYTGLVRLVQSTVGWVGWLYSTLGWVGRAGNRGGGVPLSRECISAILSHERSSVPSIASWLQKWLVDIPWFLYYYSLPLRSVNSTTIRIACCWQLKKTPQEDAATTYYYRGFSEYKDDWNGSRESDLFQMQNTTHICIDNIHTLL